jgi:hypothetical protein
MSSSNATKCILKGCNAKFINDTALASLRGKDVSLDIHNKALSVVNLYDIKECTKIIVKHGDFHEAFLQMTSTPEIQSAISAEKLKFHRQVAFMFIKQIIQAKFNKKIETINQSRRSRTTFTYDIHCPICLEEMHNDKQFTPCNHVFHRACMTQWGKNSCPVCFTNI